MEIVCDIDGILTLETGGFSETEYTNRTPKTGGIGSINNLFSETIHRVILYSARHEEDREITSGWLKINGVKYSELILGKPSAYVYFDDRSLPYIEEKIEYYRKYNFHRSCWRYGHVAVSELEKHPCFFCGWSISLTTVECSKCGIMICPNCKKCLCNIPLLSYITLIRIHEKYCCHLDKFKGVIELDGFIDNNLVKRCETVLSCCAQLEGLL